MPNGDFVKEKNEATAKAGAADKTAAESKPEKKKTAYHAAAQDWINVAKLWKGKNNRFYAESLQKAAADYRKAGEHENAGLQEEAAAKALVEAADACKATDPATAKGLLDQAARKFNTAAGDFGGNVPPDAAGQARANGEKAAAEKESKALDPVTTK